MVKLSVCIEMILREQPFLDRIDAVADAGYPAFEFWRWSGKDIEGILRKKRKYGLAVSVFGVDPMGGIANIDTKDTFLKGIQDSIEVAHKLECPSLLVTVGNEIEAVPRRRQHDNVVECLRLAAPLVEKAHITLALEPLNILVDHKGYYLSTSSEGFEILREVNSPNVKLLYDIYHMQIMEGNLIDTITKNIGSIGHFHVADVPGRHEPGTGEINYANVFSKIDEAGYKGYVGLEFRPLADSREALRTVLGIATANRS